MQIPSPMLTELLQIPSVTAVEHGLNESFLMSIEVTFSTKSNRTVGSGVITKVIK